MDKNVVIQRAIQALSARLGSGDQSLPTIIDLAVLVATADDTIDDAEMTALGHSLGQLMGGDLGPDIVKHFVRQSRHEMCAVGRDARSLALAQALRGAGAVEEGIAFAAAVALASGGLSEPERAVIDAIGSAGGASGERIEALVSAARSSANG